MLSALYGSGQLTTIIVDELLFPFRTRWDEVICKGVVHLFFLSKIKNSAFTYT